MTYDQHIEDAVKVSAPIFNAHDEVVGSLLLIILQIRVDENGPLINLAV